MVYRRKSVETHLVATRLAGIASENTLFVAVDGVTDGCYDEHTEDEIDCPPWKDLGIEKKVRAYQAWEIGVEYFCIFLAYWSINP